MLTIPLLDTLSTTTADDTDDCGVATIKGIKGADIEPDDCELTTTRGNRVGEDDDRDCIDDEGSGAFEVVPITASGVVGAIALVDEEVVVAIGPTSLAEVLDTTAGAP